MRYQWDHKKHADNVQKHGVWFSEAEAFEWDSAIVKHDERPYDETRFQAIGYIEARLYVMVFCLRETSIRIISLRKANRREVREYAET
ncbi:MAG: hypothetical protein RIQ55_192 [Pseudomonadota bacterium]|jgi:uncharacterized DUF497 family protein